MTAQTSAEFLDRIDHGDYTLIEATDANRAEALQYILDATGATSLDEATEVIRGGRPRLGDEKGENSPLVQFRVPQKVKEQIDAAASERGLSRSEYMRRALIVGMNHVA
ncbi:hypothetical protein HMPREF2946_05060 [Actinomyces sp. HMSC062G12]|nr:hypothetical protein HMPREF2946_05060 [Actinomyces sp. HMSC062G12]